MVVEDLLRNIAFPILRFSSYSANALILGTPVILLLVLRPAFATLPPDWAVSSKAAARRLEGFIRAALLASVAVTGAILLLQAALTSELHAGDVSANDIQSVFETTFGQWHALRFPLLAALAVLLIGKVELWSFGGAEGAEGAEGKGTPGPSMLWWGSWIVVGVALVATSSFSGHALVGRPQGLSIGNDILHLVFASVWFSGVILLAVVLPDAWRGRPKAERLRLLAPAVTRFSMVALVSIGIVTVTGTLNSLLHVGHLRDLWVTSYGQVLSLKLLLFIGVLILGGINHMVVRNRLKAALAAGDSAQEQDVFRRTIAAELVLALAIMAATGLMTYLSRTKTIEPTAPPASVSIRVEAS